MDLDTLNLAKKFTEQSISGTGSVAGAPCTIKSITKEGTTNTVTFEWQMRDGTVMTSEMQVEDGEQGNPGAQGDPGPEGYSPTAAMVRDEEQGIVTIVIQDKNGKHTAILKDGKAEGFDNANVLKKLSANANDDLVYNGRVVKGQEFSNKDVLDKFASDASGNIYYDKKVLTFDNADILRLLSVVDGKLAYNGQVVDFIFMNQNVLLQLSESLDGHLVYNNNKLMYDNDISNKDVLTKISADDNNNLYYNTVKVSGEKFSNKTILDGISENVDGKLTYKGADVGQTFSNSGVLEKLSEGTAGELLYKNAQVGHVFENQNVLEKLGEDPDTGNLVYNSKIIKADLDASTATIDQVPTANGKGGWTWANQASAISSLKDVELVDLKKDQTLVWDDTNQKWVNQNQSGGGSVSQYVFPQESEIYEYMQCSTAGIITDIPIRATDMIECAFDYETYNNDESIFGNSKSTDAYLQVHLTLYTNKYFSGCNNKEFNFGVTTPQSTGKHIIIYNKNNKIFFDGEEVPDITLDLKDMNETYTLGCRMKSSSNVYQGKIYYFKITNKETNEVIHNLVPVRYLKTFSLIDGQIQNKVYENCFYDKITGKVYANSYWTPSGRIIKKSSTTDINIPDGKIDLLYSGTTIEEEINLSEKISDYDILQLYGTFDTTHIFTNAYGTMNFKYDGTDILNMSTITGNGSETIAYYSDFTITSKTKITRSNIGTNNFYISQIYGIKFGSGGAGGGSSSGGNKENLPVFVSGMTIIDGLGFAKYPTTSTTDIFTTPEDGFISISAHRGSSSGYTIMLQMFSETTNKWENVSAQPAFYAYCDFNVIVPFLKGTQLRLITDGSSSTWTVDTQRFYYVEGGWSTGGGRGLSEIPIATNETLGGIKVGDSLQISDDGVLDIKKQFLQYEYVNINSSGIVTDIHILPSHTVECTFNLISEPNLACVWSNSEGDVGEAGIVRYKSKYYFGIGGGGESNERNYISSLGRHTYIFNDPDSYCYFDGVKMTEDKCNLTEIPGSYYTIGQKGTVESTKFPFPGQIAEWIVRDKETRKILHKLLPMKILSFGYSEIGLYDIITGKLYKNNQWTLDGNFIDYEGEIPVLDEEAF